MFAFLVKAASPRPGYLFGDGAADLRTDQVSVSPDWIDAPVRKLLGGEAQSAPTSLLAGWEGILSDSSEVILGPH